MGNISHPPSETIHWTPYVAACFLFYIILCSLLRFQRRDALRKKFNFPDRQSLSRMTNVEAQAIITEVAELEFPRIYYTSVQFALFKVGIPYMLALSSFC
jgi:hypothetical protein